MEEVTGGRPRGRLQMCWTNNLNTVQAIIVSISL